MSIGLPRRSLLGLGIATSLSAALTSCSRPTDPIRTPPSQTPIPPAPSLTPLASASASASASIPTRDEVVTRYAGREPREWGLRPTGVAQRSETNMVALTLDACGGPHGSGVDHRLLAFLREQNIPATLFVNARWIASNRGTFDEIAAQPGLFEVGNHGTQHKPLSVTGRAAYGIRGTASAGEVYDEVVGNHVHLTELLGAPPRFFRAGTAYYDDVAVQIVRDLGEVPIGFDVNADCGATLSAGQVAREAGSARSGSIIIAHLNQPDSGTYAGLSEALPRLRDRGLVFARCSDLGLA